MSIRVAHRVGRLQAQQTHAQAQVDAAVEPAAERDAHRGLGEEAAARPQMNRQERLIFTVYAVMLVMIAAFLAATAVLWWLGG